MEGIQLFGVPSINLKRSALCICAQNHGTSGREIRKPPSANRLAIQRMASLFSLGTNRRISAPTSGVKRMIESMWFCMKVQLLASSCVSVVHVIKNKPYQSRGHHQRVPLHQTPLKQPRGIRQHPRQNCWTVDADAIDD